MHSKKLLKKLYKAMNEFISVMMQTFSLKGHSSGTPRALRVLMYLKGTWPLEEHSKGTRATRHSGTRALEALAQLGKHFGTRVLRTLNHSGTPALEHLGTRKTRGIF